jgi:type 1 glutamine amidotransferase
MKIYTYFKTTIILLLLITVSFSVLAKPKVLVFSKTAGFHHASIAAGIPAIIKLGQENNFDVDTTTDASKFSAANLKQYAAVIFLSTTGTVFNDAEREAFKKYIESGGGFVGIHSATDTEYDWPWYGKLVGAYFKNHPSKQQEATLHIVDPKFIATKGLPAEWKRLDEWYNFRVVPSDKDVHVLITIDEKTYEGGNDGAYHPMSWYHNYDGGRAFYTALGHTDESYSDPLYLKHILGGIEYAMGKKK